MNIGERVVIWVANTINTIIVIVIWYFTQNSGYEALDLFLLVSSIVILENTALSDNEEQRTQRTKKEKKRWRLNLETMWKM